MNYLIDWFSEWPNNLTIELTTGTCNLSQVLNFAGVSNITIRGKGSQQTRILCNRTNAGLVFNKSSNVELYDFTIDSCGANTEAKHVIGNASKSIAIIQTNDVVMQGLAIINSHGYGLLMHNSFGHVILDGLKFYNNRLSGQDLKDRSGGGGLTIVFREHQNQQTSYIITSCRFEDNSGNVERQKRTIFNPVNAEKGGGMSVHYLRNSFDVDVTVYNCSFTNNTGTYGGGLYGRMSHNASNCNLFVSESEFIGNHAEVYGGGGTNVGFTTIDSFPKKHVRPKNSITFGSVLFKGNVGYFGGGASVFGSSSDPIKSAVKSNSVLFENCYFIHNSATRGAAVDVRPYVAMEHGTIFTSVIFSNVTFTENFPTQLDSNENSVFWSSEVMINFDGDVTFTNNKATALYSASALLVFNPYSTVKFLGNSGEKGGAVLLAGESRMQLSNNIHFTFINNSASYYGGAICAQPTQVHGFIFTDSCFLYPDNLPDQDENIYNNITLVFEGNSAATGIGKNIFATSLAPCLGICQYHEKRNISTQEIFDGSCIGKFIFDQGTGNGSIATCPQSIECANFYNPIPGFSLDLKITQIDEMGNNVGGMFILTAKLKNSTSTNTSLEHLMIVQNSVTFRGIPGDSGEISIEISAPINRKKSVHFELANCPPGFTVQDKKCKCSAYDESRRYFGISTCHDKAALITLGYWAGYYDNDSSALFTGNCVAAFCNYSAKDLMRGQHLLPSTTVTKDELEKAVCGDSRRGVLCGICAHNFTMLFHSQEYKCYNKSLVNCFYGIPLYIVSELLPVTVLFLVILIFNINLTSGALYSFVFYAQVFNSQYVTAFGTAEVQNKIANSILTILKVAYGFFNMNMLNIDSLSFCLISDANAMDLFMFQYGTTLYAVLLVIVTVLVLRLHSCYCCVKLGRCCGRRNIRGSIVDGLSAFLVLCYFQCTRTTFNILSPVTLKGIGEKNYETVLLFNGDAKFFGLKHLPYAIPAIFCLIVVIIPPPCILVLEPVFTKLCSLKIMNRKVTYFYTKGRMKIMPFLDSFQGSFKDNYRSFAGLYFFYRVIITATYMSATVFSSFVFVEITLFIIIFTHAMFRPYKKLWHSLLDIGILINLLYVNTTTLLHYAAIVWGDVDASSEAKMLVWLQIMAAFLPIAYLVIYAVIATYRNCKSFNQQSPTRTRFSVELPDDSTDLPARLLESRDYNTF